MSSPSVCVSRFLFCAVLLSACAGDDAEPQADAGAVDGSVLLADGGRPADGSLTVPAGPPVQVDLGGATRLALRGDRVCKLDGAGDIVCRAGATGAFTLGKTGPFVGFTFSGDGWSGCALSADGTPSCWTGSEFGTYVPLCSGSDGCVAGGVPPAGVHFSEIALGSGYGCGVTGDGSLRCWGSNHDDAHVPPSGNDFSHVAAGSDLTCALRRDGASVCWGDTFFVDPEPVGSPGSAIAVADDGACVLVQGGSVQCDGFASPPTTSTPVALARFVLSESGGCGVDAQGKPLCWGNVLGRITPLPGPFSELSVQGDDACGLRGDGEVQCWGTRFGNGAGDETCGVGRAELTVAGAARTFDTGSAAWTLTSQLSASGWGFGTQLGAAGLAFIRGSGAVGSSYPGGARSALDDGRRYPLTLSYWLFDASDASTGPITCAAGDSASVTRNGDELVVDIRQAGTLPGCPGAPVAGEVHACARGGCGDGSALGAIDGKPWTSERAGYAFAGTSGTIDFQDGSQLYVRGNGATTGDFASWGLLFTAPDGPLAGKVYCVGALSRRDDGASFDRDYVLGELSELAACPLGSEAVLGCVR